MKLNYSLGPSFLPQFTNMNKTSLIKIIIKEENKLDLKYKTEICKKFQSIGNCPYGDKCRFAHGKQELLIMPKGKNYKKIPCKTFFKKGYCSYGSKCNFQHNEKDFSKINYSFYYFQLFLITKYNSNNHSSRNFCIQLGVI